MQRIRPRSGAQSAARHDVGGEPVGVIGDVRCRHRRGGPEIPDVPRVSHAAVGRSGWARRDARFCVPRTFKQGEPKWNFRNGLSME
jgi:hypothetical protein